MSAFELSHVSCKQSAPKYKPEADRLLISGNKLLNFALILCTLSASIWKLLRLCLKTGLKYDMSMYRKSRKFTISCSESTNDDNTWLRSFSVPVRLSKKSTIAHISHDISWMALSIAFFLVIYNCFVHTRRDGWRSHPMYTIGNRVMRITISACRVT